MLLVHYYTPHGKFLVLDFLFILLLSQYRVPV